MKKIMLCLLIIFALTACSDDTNVITTEYDGIYQIDDQSIVYHVNDERITKLKTNEINFYIYEPNKNEKELYSSILSSVYNKYKKDIKSIAKKNNLTITFKHSTDDYLDKQYFKEQFMIINTGDKDDETINKFVTEVMEIDEISKLYQVWTNINDSSYYVYDFSNIINSSEEKGISLFEYYKNLIQEKKKETSEKKEENKEEMKEEEKSSQED